MGFSHSSWLLDSVAFKSLMALIEERFGTENEAAERGQPEFEGKLRESMRLLECEIHERDFERMDFSVPGVVVDGVRYMAQPAKTRGEYTTLAGVIHPLRSTYRARGGHGGKTIVPLELRLGLVGGNWTPLAAQVAGAFIESQPSSAAAELLEKAGGMAPSASHLDRLPKLVQEKWEEDRENLEKAVRDAEQARLPKPGNVALILVSLDGILVPMKDAPREPGLGKEDVGPKGHKEVGCGTIALFDGQGTRLHTIRLARMPEEKKATLKQQIRAEVLRMRQIYPSAKFEGIADGADDNWRFLKQLAQELGVDMCLVTDYFHAAEHLTAGIMRYAGAENKEDGKNTAEFFRTVLRDHPNGAKKVIAALKYRAERCRGQKRKDIEAELTYFINHENLMQYARLRAEHLPIGSGIMEACCKTLVGQRLKQSGMSWRNAGGQGILLLRSMRQSDRIADAWAVLLPKFRKEVKIDQNTGRKLPERRVA